MIDVIEIISDPKYKHALNKCLAFVKGIENKEDANSCAIVALLEEEPITIDDCIVVMQRAIWRENKKRNNILNREHSIDESLNYEVL